MASRRFRRQPRSQGEAVAVEETPAGASSVPAGPCSASPDASGGPSPLNSALPPFRFNGSYRLPGPVSGRDPGRRLPESGSDCPRDDAPEAEREEGDGKDAADADGGDETGGAELQMHAQPPRARDHRSPEGGHQEDGGRPDVGKPAQAPDEHHLERVGRSASPATRTAGIAIASTAASPV